MAVLARGGGIYLRAMAESDINERYLAWFSDTSVTHFLDARNLTHDAALGYLRAGRESGTRHQFAICAADSGLQIGSVKLGEIEMPARVSDLVTLIGDRDYWGKGIATTAIRLGSQVAFERHNIRKLNGGIHSANIGSIKAYTRGGWVIEAVLHSHHVDASGGLCDRVIVSCFNPQEYPALPHFPLALPQV